VTLRDLVVHWARTIDAPALVVGEIGAGHRVDVALPGETARLVVGQASAGLHVVDLPDRPGDAVSSRPLVVGVLTPRQLRRALTRLGYG
jgi:hypothetical protein